MRYIALIYGNEALEAQQTDAQRQAVFDAYMAFGQDEQVRPTLLGGDALHPTSSATTVRVRDGKLMTTDGPFAETKEQLGGFYLIQAENLDQAIAVAAKIPGASTGSVEVRPIWEF